MVLQIHASDTKVAEGDSWCQTHKQEITTQEDKEREDDVHTDITTQGDKEREDDVQAGDHNTRIGRVKHKQEITTQG